MATTNKEKTYWPHMIIGFLFMAITLGYWTVKSASSMPVQESNVMMQKYQLVEININEITAKKEAFERDFALELLDKKIIVNEDNKFSKRKQFHYIELLPGKNSFTFKLTSKNGASLDNPKITFLLTRPHTRVDDQYFEKVALKDNRITIDDVQISKKGRYIIALRIDTADGKIGYFEQEAYLN